MPKRNGHHEERGHPPAKIRKRLVYAGSDCPRVPADDEVLVQLLPGAANELDVAAARQLGTNVAGV